MRAGVKTGSPENTRKEKTKSPADSHVCGAELRNNGTENGGAGGYR